MGAWRVVLLLLVASLVALAIGTGCAGAKPSATPTALPQGPEQTVQTASYRVRLVIGPAVLMPTPDLFHNAKGDEVMGLMAHMAMMDQGQSVDRHPQIYIQDRRSGAEVKDVVPRVRITGRPAGASRELTNVTACLLARHKVFPHFGDNLHLPQGEYTVTVGMGNETASFEIAL